LNHVSTRKPVELCNMRVKSEFNVRESVARFEANHEEFYSGIIEKTLRSAR